MRCSRRGFSTTFAFLLSLSKSDLYLLSKLVFDHLSPHSPENFHFFLITLRKNWLLALFTLTSVFLRCEGAKCLISWCFGSLLFNLWLTRLNPYSQRIFHLIFLTFMIVLNQLEGDFLFGLPNLFKYCEWHLGRVMFWWPPHILSLRKELILFLVVLKTKTLNGI